MPDAHSLHIWFAQWSEPAPRAAVVTCAADAFEVPEAAVDRLSIMKSFVSVAEAGSFAAAAGKLGLSRALITRHIAELETQLGTHLLIRSTRTISLTETGHVHLDFCRHVLGQFQVQEEFLRGLGERPAGSLSVISPKWIGSLDLGDAIATFASHHPMIKVRLELGGMAERTPDLLGNGFDIAFRTMNLRDSSLMVRRIAKLQFVLCAAPSYLGSAGRPTDPMDLTRHACLLHTGDPIWHFCHGEETMHVKPVDVAFTSNTFAVLQKAAVRGMGIALLPMRSVQGELDRGELLPLMPAFRVHDRPLFAVHAADGSKLRRIQCFLDFIADWYRGQSQPTEMPVEAASSED